MQQTAGISCPVLQVIQILQVEQWEKIHLLLVFFPEDRNNVILTPCGVP